MLFRSQSTIPVGLSNVVAIAAGGFHSLALEADGTVVAWGNNKYGQTNVPALAQNAMAVAGAGTFAFLHETPHWDAESICLAHVMNDPAVATVLVQARDIPRLEALSKIPDRDMPPGLSAQIEMARVGAANKVA